MYVSMYCVMASDLSDLSDLKVASLTIFRWSAVWQIDIAVTFCRFVVLEIDLAAVFLPFFAPQVLAFYSSGLRAYDPIHVDVCEI